MPFLSLCHSYCCTHNSQDEDEDEQDKDEDEQDDDDNKSCKMIIM